MATILEINKLAEIYERVLGDAHLGAIDGEARRELFVAVKNTQQTILQAIIDGDSHRLAKAFAQAQLINNTKSDTDSQNKANKKTKLACQIISKEELAILAGIETPKSKPAKVTKSVLVENAQTKKPQ